MKYLLDTNICIYIINHHPEQVKKKFAEIEIGEIGISSLTVAELAFGAENSGRVLSNLAALKRFISPLHTVPFEEADAFAYGKIRAALHASGTPIGSMDMLIAAQALARDLIVVTNNTREFERITEVQVENWV